MPKDASKNIDRYKIQGGTLNQFEFAENQQSLAQNAPQKSENLIPGTPPEERQRPQVAAKKTGTKKIATKGTKKNAQSAKSNAKSGNAGSANSNSTKSKSINAGTTKKSAQKAAKKTAKATKTRTVVTRGASAK